MAPWRGVVPILALSASLARSDANADALTLPTSSVRPSLDPVTLSHFLQPHTPHRTPSPLAELANSPLGQSAAWLGKALLYGTVCDLLVVRLLLQRLLGHPVFGRGKAAPPPPPAPALQGLGLGPEGHHGHAQGRGEAAEEADGGPSQLQAAGLGLCVLVLCAGLARAVSRRRQPPPGAALAGAVAVRGDRGRACVAALPHGLVQRRGSLEAPRRTAKHVTWRSEEDWMQEEEKEVEEARSQHQRASNQADPNTQFFRICSEAPAGVDAEDTAEAAARRQAADEEAARRSLEEEARRRKEELEAQRKLAEAAKVRALPALTAAGAAQLRAVVKRGMVEVVSHSAEGRPQPKPAPGERVVVTGHTADVGRRGTVLRSAEAGAWAVRLDGGALATLGAEALATAPPPVATLALKREIDFVPLRHGDPITTAYAQPLEAKKILDDLAEVLKIYDTVLVSIEGHTATPKVDDWSFRLAQGRADKVGAALAEAGVDADRLKPIGLPGHQGSGRHDMVLKVVSL